ncbi:hypothetical protein CONLIGDRAFT_690824 [Coniochaeta ligniaria NRRL 30616]|uniref:Uncharacterized protein n=1 Tax=Coniochaeta ligniaria NRRL 30616 TaxID=1408157 RepID=A0A1J7ICT2_9PEZI|nr:hypothetical protein CONLIGDRAFT_690824 [Coniochaeta ligniaria NRRL 30616]
MAQTIPARLRRSWPSGSGQLKGSGLSRMWVFICRVSPGFVSKAMSQPGSGHLVLGPLPASRWWVPALCPSSFRRPYIESTGIPSYAGHVLAHVGELQGSLVVDSLLGLAEVAGEDLSGQLQLHLQALGPLGARNGDGFPGGGLGALVEGGLAVDKLPVEDVVDSRFASELLSGGGVLETPADDVGQSLVDAHSVERWTEAEGEGDIVDVVVPRLGLASARGSIGRRQPTVEAMLYPVSGDEDC